MRPRTEDVAPFLALAEMIGSCAREHGLTVQQRENAMHEAARRYWDESQEADRIALDMAGEIANGVTFDTFISRTGSGRPAAPIDPQMRWDMNEGVAHGDNGG